MTSKGWSAKDALIFSSLELTHFFFHLFARLERHDKFRADKNLIASTRITGLAGCTFLDFKDTKVSQFDTVLRIFNKGLDDRVKRLLDDVFDLQLRLAHLVGNLFDDLFLGHSDISKGD